MSVKLAFQKLSWAWKCVLQLYMVSQKPSYNNAYFLLFSAYYSKMASQLVVEPDVWYYRLCVTFTRPGEESSIVDQPTQQYMRYHMGEHISLISIPDAEHHVFLDQPVAVAVCLRALLAEWNRSSVSNGNGESLDRLAKRSCHSDFAGDDAYMKAHSEKSFQRTAQFFLQEVGFHFDFPCLPYFWIYWIWRKLTLHFIYSPLFCTIFSMGHFWVGPTHPEIEPFILNIDC